MSLLDLVDDFNKECLEAARKDGVARRKARRSGCRTWPMRGDIAVKIHPSQVEEFRERNKREGIAVDYDSRGVALISGPAAYKKLLKANGLHNKDSYGGIY